MLSFEWDSLKAKKNLRIHRISFDEACTAFKDTLSLTIFDPLHSEKEDRYVLIGSSYKDRLLVVIHTERNRLIRIISARKANITERRRYEENAKRSRDAGRI